MNKEEGDFNNSLIFFKLIELELKIEKLKKKNKKLKNKLNTAILNIPKPLNR